MKYLQAHPKIKELVARSFFTTTDELDRNMSIATQAIACSEFLAVVVSRTGGVAYPHLMEFLERYVGTYPNVGLEYPGSVMRLEFCAFLGDGSRDGVLLEYYATPDSVVMAKVVKLVGVFGVTTERVLQEINL